MKKTKINNKINHFRIIIRVKLDNNNNQLISNHLQYSKRRILVVEFLVSKSKIHKYNNNHNNNHNYNNHKYPLNQIQDKINQKKKQISNHFDSLIYIYIFKK